MRIKSIIFDMDGVLIDSEKHYVNAHREMFGLLGLSFDESKLRVLQGASYKTYGETMRRSYGNLPYSDERLGELYNEALLRALHAGVKSMVPGVQEWIRRFTKMGCTLAIASASTYALVEYTMNSFGFKPDIIVCGDDARRGKPDPEIFLLAAKRLERNPDECLVLEDSYNGINAALAAGMHCAAFSGALASEVDQSAAHMVVSAYDDSNWRQLVNQFSLDQSLN